MKGIAGNCKLLCSYCKLLVRSFTARLQLRHINGEGTYRALPHQCACEKFEIDLGQAT